MEKPINKWFQYCCIIFVIIQCNSRHESIKITNYYNKVINNNIVQTLGNGNIHWQMKYLLDTILIKNVKVNELDTKFCIFEFFDFSYSGIAFFIDSNDTIYYRLTELNGDLDSKKALTAKFSIGDSIYNVFYLIKEQRISSSFISNRCDFNAFFLNKPCSIMEMRVGDDGPSINIILKLWRNTHGALVFEFYDRFGPIFYSEHNKIQNVIESDSIKSKKMKIKFYD